MAVFSEATLKQCNGCDYYTASEKSIRKHLLEGDCPEKATSYTEIK